MGRQGVKQNNMVQIAVTIIAALAATGAVNLITRIMLGRDIAVWGLVLIALGFVLVGWRALMSYRSRERRRLLDMRDSALW